MEKKKENKIFLGCMFIGLGAGFIIDNIPGGILIGMGIGYLSQHFSNDEANLKENYFPIILAVLTFALGVLLFFYKVIKLL